MWASVAVPGLCAKADAGASLSHVARQLLPGHRAGLAGGHSRAGAPCLQQGCTDLATLPAALQRSLLRALLKLDEHLSTPLEHELTQDPQLRVSQRHFLDRNHLTLADCNLLPKLNIVQVSHRHPSTMPFSFT